MNNVFTARKRSLGQGNMFTGVCLSTGGVLSQHALQVVSQHALQQVSGGWGVCYPSMHCRWYPSMPCSRSWGGLQAHSQGGSGGGSGLGPQPRGKLRGIWSREGTCSGGDAWSRGGGACFGGDACSGGCLVETPPDGYCCGPYASYWNAFLFRKKCL